MEGVSRETQGYRWVICACSFLILFVSNGMTIGGLSVFDEELLKALAASTGNEIPLGDFKTRDAIMFATAGVLGLGAGWLADRVGVKPLIIVGLALLAAGNYAYSFVQTLTDIFWIQAGFGVVLVLCGLMVNVYLISRWFVRQRGLAIGLVLAGTSLGNAFFPKFNIWLMSMGDWQQVFQWLALVPLILLPVAFFLLRSAPRRSTSVSEQPANGIADPLYGYTLKEALTSRNFWIIALIAMCTFYSVLGMSTHTFLYLRTENYAPQVAATGVTILFIGGLVGKVLSGFMAENFGRKRIILIGLALMLFGSVMLVSAIALSSAGALWAGLVLFGFGWGGIYTLIQLLSADLFGLRALGKILAAINILDTFGGALGPMMTGRLFDSFGSYLVPFSVITALLLVATMAAAFLRMEDGAYHQIEALQMAEAS